MKNNITITHDIIRKLKNKVQKKTYNKKKGINQNINDEITLLTNIIIPASITRLGKRFINKLRKEKGNQQKTMD